MVKKSPSKKPRYDYRLFALLATCITLGVYVTSFDADFVNWDDQTYIAENPVIQDLNTNNLKQIFAPDRFLIGNYHPLTELSFAINFALSKLNPTGYIATNVLLHLLNTILVFFFFYRFSNKQVDTAFIVSLLFGIHPMHVESVCWISERKDVLYVFFYLLALLSYLSFYHTSKKSYYILALASFSCALLSKGQAVTFPLVLLLIHFWHRDLHLKKLLFTLGPLFLLSLTFGLLAIHAQDQALNVTDLTLINRIIVGSYGLMVYLVKVLLPFGLSALHPYPSGLEWPGYFYLMPIAVLSFLITLGWSFRKNRILFFGLAFFTLTVFPVLQFLPVGMSMHAERYTYLPYLGLFFIMGHYYHQFNVGHFWKKSKLQYPITLALYVTAMAIIARDRTDVWKSSETLWLDVIKKYPHDFAAYLNLTYYYCVETNQLSKAVQYADQGIRDAGHNVYLYDNKAYALLQGQDYREALAVLDTALKYVAPDIQFFINQGDAHVGLQDGEGAIKSYTKALEINPIYVPALMKRATTYIDILGDPGSSDNDLAKILVLDPTNQEALAMRQKIGK